MSDANEPDDHDQHQLLTVRVFEGFCNRLNTLATALTTGREVKLHWAVNQHCPARFEQLLDPLECFTVVNEEVAGYEYAVGPNELCWFYPRNLDRLPHGEFRRRMYASYRYLHECLKVTDHPKLPLHAFGLQFRRYFGGSDNLVNYLAWVEQVLQQLRPELVYVASDCPDCKGELVRRVQSHGVVAAQTDCPLLGNDLDRSLGNVLGMCRDLRALSQCQLGVLANSTRSTIADSLRAFGVQAYYTFDDGFHRHQGRDELFEMLSVASLLAPGDKS